MAKGFKTGGRKAGIPNKLTSEIKSKIESLIEKYLFDDIKKLQPDKRAELLVKLLPYLIPKAKDEIEASNSDSPLVITIVGEKFAGRQSD